MPVSDAKEMILRTSAKELLKYRPSWLKDCVRISVSVQDITTGEILYRRTINIKKSAKIGALALWDSWCGRSVRFRRSHTTLKTKEERK